MSALFESGYFFREPAWHGQGNVRDQRPQDWREFRQWAGMEWDPVEEEVYRLTGISEQGLPEYRPTPGVKLVTRSDTGDMLAHVNDTYTIIDHNEMGGIADVLLGDREVSIESGGVLDGGKNVWALFQLGEPITIKGDTSVTLPYVALLNDHTGKSALTAISTAIRVVCMNTYKAAEYDASRRGTSFSIRHTSGYKDRLEQGKLVLAGARQEFVDYVAWAEMLTGFTVSDAQFEQALQAFFYPKGGTEVVSEGVKANIDDAMRMVRINYTESRTGEGIRGNAYGVTMAFGEYLDHQRGYRDTDSFTGRTLLKAEPFKKKVTQVLGEVIGQKLFVTAA